MVSVNSHVCALDIGFPLREEAGREKDHFSRLETNPVALNRRGGQNRRLESRSSGVCRDGGDLEEDDVEGEK